MSNAGTASGARPVLAPLTTRPENLTTRVFTAIRDRIVDSSLPPGSAVSEAMLASQLQVSKTPVREALLRLRHIGLVESTSRRLRVVQPSAARIRDAFEFRCGIERMAARYAAGRATPEQLGRIVDLAGASLAAATEGRVADFLRYDFDFHLAVAEATGNEVLLQAVENAVVLTSTLRRRDVRVDRDFVRDADEHVGIAELIAARSQDRSAGKLADHIDRIMLNVLELFAAEAPLTNNH
ncbi:GntR family transcriptional regulator [Amycolatopsis sp. GM8]|uniref:GntR family transcriptional regulator n=1 Tax=Amycolatopsis sp. GM8 TaxID=2896530 RepID=UPI001F329204|nr:GntR family transcriptional regulator [Amycolatopsis sp. GM8]